MDWAQDNASLSDSDLVNVFKYEEKPTTVVRVLTGKEQPITWSLDGKVEWNDWIENECPHINSPASGLVLILAKRTGESYSPCLKNAKSQDWLKCFDEPKSGRPKVQKAMIPPALIEKNPSAGPSGGVTSMTGPRSVRKLPFAKETFRLITKKFYTHGSIARVISRAHVSVFSSADIQMEDQEGHTYPAYVYNCRSSNAWDMDLALTVTYFPHNRLTFAILFGCPLSVEREIIKRLSLTTAEVAHPLLMPGIFVEIERNQHVLLVENINDELEMRIFELDSLSSDTEGLTDSEARERNQAKRSAWLNTMYLKNALVSWSTQLTKLGQHADELKETVFKQTLFKENPYYEKLLEENIQQYESYMVQVELRVSKERLRRIGDKIHSRTQTIIDEYDDKIRECTMRIEGTAIATQWASEETNLEIALFTYRDSRHMRSIAIVTMVFLPGTFLATVFSMTFFNWFGQSGHVVSSYFWIYIVITVFFTLLTLTCWWYFISYRPSRLRKRAKKLSEEQIPLV